MDTSRAHTKYVRISPQKARLAAALIRGLPVKDAEQQLIYSKLKAGMLLNKTLRSAVANAESNHGARPEELSVLEVRVDGGPSLKRGKARSRGSKSPILKRTSHFTIVVGNKE